MNDKQNQSEDNQNSYMFTKIQDCNLYGSTLDPHFSPTQDFLKLVIVQYLLVLRFLFTTRILVIMSSGSVLSMARHVPSA